MPGRQQVGLVGIGVGVIEQLPGTDDRTESGNLEKDQRHTRADLFPLGFASQISITGAGITECLF